MPNKYQFKLLAGRYCYNAGDDQKPKLVRYAMGDIIETPLPLDEMFNSPGSTKFERLSHEVEDTEDTLAAMELELERRKAALAEKRKAEIVPIDTGDELSSKSLDDLRMIATANQIAFDKKASKPELLKIIRAALQPA